MQHKILMAGVILMTSLAASAGHALGTSTRPAGDARATRTVPAAPTDCTTAADRQALLQPPSALTSTHRSGMAPTR